MTPGPARSHQGPSQARIWFVQTPWDFPGASETLQNTSKVEWKLQKILKVQGNLALYLYPVLEKGQYGAQ